jgi:hypothetical protein
MEWMPPDDPTGYDGPAGLLIGDDTIDVVVHLDGHLEPLDGRFHWYGRIEQSAAVRAAKGAGATSGLLRIGEGAPTEVRLAEDDPWGSVQVNGTGAPPYPMGRVEVDLPALGPVAVSP